MVTAEPCPTTQDITYPTAPNTLEEAGLSVDMVLQLTLKTLHFAGQLRRARNAINHPVSFRSALRQLETGPAQSVS